MLQLVTLSLLVSQLLGKQILLQLQLVQLFLFLLQLHLDGIKFSLRGLELIALRLYLFVNDVVLADGDYPLADALSCD